MPITTLETRKSSSLTVVCEADKGFVDSILRHLLAPALGSPPVAALKMPIMREHQIQSPPKFASNS